MKIRSRKIAPKKTTRKYTASHLNLVDKSHTSILNKTKTSTIRLGQVFFVDKILPLKFEKKPDIVVKIKAINYNKPLKDLSKEDATIDGFSTLNELKTALQSFYPECDENSEFTIVHFDIHQ